MIIPLNNNLKLDDTDIKILTELQKDSHIKRNELSEKIGLSLPSTLDRISKLEAHGIIKQFTSTLDYKALGYDITCFIFIESDSSKHYKDITANALKTPEVLECHSITGEGSHILKIRTENTSSLEKLLAKIQTWPGVHSTRTSIVLSTIKEISTLDLNAHFKKDEFKKLKK